MGNEEAAAARAACRHRKAGCNMRGVSPEVCGVDVIGGIISY